MSFPPSFLDELRSRVSLVDVVGRRVQYDRRKSHPGKADWWACCPFHSEKTPSFHVEGRRGFYHCFGCGAKGDAVRFLMETERMSFREAVESLAREAGLSLPEPTPQARAAERARRSLHELVDSAAQFFGAALAAPSGKAARDYIAGRELTPDTVAKFRLGYAPGTRTALRDHLAKSGATVEEMETAGLVIRPEDNSPSYDRFRNRLIFPILDGQGRVIAFGGRALAPDAQPKYLNSPEGPLFHKSSVLYNLAAARGASRQTGTLIVVEGYMDVIALDQAGLPHAVAPLGTALTEDHLALLWRLVPEPILCFDGDAAGQRAATHAAHRALPHLKPGLSLRIVTLPEGRDPDDLVRAHGKAGIDAVLASAMPLAEMLWRGEMEAAPIDTPERRAALEERVMNRVNEIADRSVREHYRADMRARLNRLFGRGAAFVKQNKGLRRNARFAPPSDLPPSASMKGHALAHPHAELSTRCERHLLIGVLTHPELLLTEMESLAEAPFQTPDLADLRDIVVARADRLSGVTFEVLREQLSQDGYRDRIDRLLCAQPLESFEIRQTPFSKLHDAWKRELSMLWRHVLEEECKTAEQALAGDMTDENMSRLVALKGHLATLSRESTAVESLGPAQSGREHPSGIDVSRSDPHIGR